jgi:hypothetical protein
MALALHAQLVTGWGCSRRRGRDMPFSISAGVGVIALFGVTVLEGCYRCRSGVSSTPRDGRRTTRSLSIEAAQL